MLLLPCIAEAQAVDLSTPSSALITCRQAFHDENTPILEKCLSERLKKELKRNGPSYIRLWKSCFENCGGWDRKILEVRQKHKFAGVAKAHPEDKLAGTENAPANVYVYQTPAASCQDYTKMIKEDDGWKFDES